MQTESVQCDGCHAHAQSEDYYQTVVDENSDPIFTVAVDSDGEFRIDHVNSAFERMHEVSAQAILGRSPRDCLPESAATEAIRGFARAVETGSPVVFDGQASRGGERLTTVTTVTPLLDRDGRCYRLACIVRDVTAERRSTEAAHRLAQIVRASEDAICTLGMDNLYTSWNRGAEEMLGYSEAEAIGASLREIVPISRMAERAILFERLKDGERLVDWETERVRKDGTIIPVSLSAFLIFGADGSPVEGGVILRDMTARQALHAALEESEQIYRNLVETAVEGIWVIDADNETTFVNQRMADILGYRPEEMVGTALFDYMDGEGRAQALVNLERRRRGIAEQHEFKFRSKDGHPVWTLVATKPFLSDAGQYLGTLGMITDVTSWKVAEEEARQAKITAAVLEERSRMAEKLHDDVAQSFFAIGLATRRLRETLGPAPGPVADGLLTIQRLAESGGRQTRTAIHALSADASPASLDLAIRGAMELFRQECGITCSYVGIDPAPDVDGVAASVLAAAARELLTNVWKHSGAGQVEVSSLREDGKVSLTVADNGCGDAAVIASAAGGQASFGLPQLVQRLAKVGGSLSAGARPGGGVSIEVTVPSSGARP